MTEEAKTLKIGGVLHSLRNTRRAAFRLGGLAYPPPSYSPEWDGNTLFRWAVIHAWAMLADGSAFRSPEDLADALADDEVRPLLDAVNAALSAQDEAKKN